MYEMMEIQFSDYPEKHLTMRTSRIIFSNCKCLVSAGTRRSSSTYPFLNKNTKKLIY